jgi:hypothetical protein
MEFVGPSFSTTKFDVKFTRVAETIFQGQGFRRTFMGQAHFEVGVNGTMTGVCGGSGVCSWGLKEGVSPVSIQQSELSGS